MQRQGNNLRVSRKFSSATVILIFIGILCGVRRQREKAATP
jgi:hypothetical protein